MDVVAYILGVVEFAEHDKDTILLVRLEHMVEGIVDREHKQESDGKHPYHPDDVFLFVNQVVSQREDEQATQDDIHDRLGPNEGEDKQENSHYAGNHHQFSAREAFAIQHEDEGYENDS